METRWGKAIWQQRQTGVMYLQDKEPRIARSRQKLGERRGTQSLWRRAALLRLRFQTAGFRSYKRIALCVQPPKSVAIC